VHGVCRRNPKERVSHGSQFKVTTLRPPKQEVGSHSGQEENSGFAFAMFGFDKWRAGRSDRRVQERTLILCGALGGWVGGLVGRESSDDKF
jgi:hypothetical protein